jgi:D-lactate dehydrogenase
MKIAVFSTKSYDRQYFDKFSQHYQHELTYFDAPFHSATVGLANGFEAICVFVNDKIDREMLQKMATNGIKIIALRCAGFNNVDIAAAQEYGVRVVRVPAYSPQAVAEHALALILTLNRKTHKAYNRVRESNFSLENLIGFNLYQKTVGVIGTGQIGTAFCEIMLGFGCKIIATDVKESDYLKSKGVVYQSLDAILRESDIISLHCPLMPQTHYLLGAAEFAKMKKGVMLINTSRGALINTAEAIKALKNKHLGYLGLDVYEQEEHLFFKDLSESIIQDDVIARLMSFPNVLITAHQGFLTEEALTQIAQTTLQSLQDFEQGKTLKHEVKIS